MISPIIAEQQAVGEERPEYPRPGVHQCEDCGFCTKCCNGQYESDGPCLDCECHDEDGKS